MQKDSFLLKNCRLANGEIKDILIEGEFIKAIDENISFKGKIIDVDRNLVIPALIDPHTHIRDLNQAYKEDWGSGSMAALSSGHSFIFDMPNTLPPTTNLKNFYKKLEKAKKSQVKYRLNIGATNDNIKDLKEILTKEYELIGAIKVFMASSSDNEVVDTKNLKKIFQLAKDFDKTVIIHTELQDCIKKWYSKIKDKTIYNHHLIRNRECAVIGTKLVVKIANEIGNRLYIAHVSTKEEVSILKDNPHIFAEVTPHHLFLNINDVKNIGMVAKVNPPIRTKEDNIALINAVKEGIIDVIATDHAPHSLQEKQNEYTKAPSGFPGLETKLPLLITAAKKGILSYKDITNLMAKNPAKIFGLEKRGELKKGYFADICVVDDNKSYTIRAKNFKSKAKYSPFEGKNVFGVVKSVIIEGKIKFGG